MTKLARTIICGASAILTASCGGPTTSSGVGYDTKSASDIQSECRRMLESYASAIPNAESQRREEAQIDPCCREVAKLAEDMTAEQRTYAWNDFVVAQDLTLPSNQRDAARSIRDAIGGDLAPADRRPASGLRYDGLTCMSSRARQN